MQLVADKLCLDRGGRQVLDGISFIVETGEALLLTGPNGAGKTSLLRAIAGFLRPSTGQVRLEGGSKGADIAEQSHLLGHRDGVKASLTVRENAEFYLEYLGGTSGDDIPTALARLGLAGLAEIPAGYLSAGQRRRLGLSRLLLARRPLWLLDEPTVSLDSASIAALMDMISEHLGGGGLLIAATHVPLDLLGARELPLGEIGVVRAPRDAGP
jgi:heme exporter protein A